MNARSREQDPEAGLEEYEFLYIAPPVPSRNWRDRGAMRWTNIALWGLLTLVSVGTLTLLFYIAHRVHEAWKVVSP
jgi:hypothetical protein